MKNLTEKELRIFNNLSRVQSPSVSLGETIQGIISSITASEDTPVNAVRAFVILTILTQPTVGDTVTIGEKVYTFVVDAVADGDVALGIDLAATKTSLVAAINGLDYINTPNSLVMAPEFDDDECAITAILGGTDGNNISVAETFTDESNNFATNKLTNGVDGTIGVKGTFKFDSSYVYFAVDDNTVSDANWRRVSLGTVY